MLSMVVGVDEGEVSSVGCGSLGDFAKALGWGGKYIEANGALYINDFQLVAFLFF